MEQAETIEKVQSKLIGLRNIPIGWKSIKLKDAVYFLDGKRKPIKESDREKMHGEFPYYGASGIIDYVNNYIFDDELILLGEDGANILNRSSRLAFKVNGQIWVNNHAHVLKPKKDFDIDFLVDYLESLDYRKYNTSISQPKLNKAVCEKIEILKPPYDEQLEIGRILSTWDEAIDKTRKLIKQLELRKKGLMHELLKGENRLPGFDGEWKEYRYEDILKEVRRQIDWDDNELYRLISVRRRSGGLFHRDSLYGREILTKNLRTAKAGDYLISKMQIVHGASGMVTEEFDNMKISGSYISLIARQPEILDIIFFNWLSKLPYFYHQTFISSYGVHIEKMTFNYKTFLKLKICIPSLEEQKSIIQILENSELVLKKEKEILKKLKLQKKGLMQQLLTGEKRVKI